MKVLSNISVIINDQSESGMLLSGMFFRQRNEKTTSEFDKDVAYHTSHINPCHREEKAFEHVQIKPDCRVHTNGLPQRDDSQSKREQKSPFYPLKMKLSLIVF